MPNLRTVVVVGASLAGLRAVETLRKKGFDGQLVLVGAESHLPYDRPPLSKEVLRGEWETDRIALRTPESWDDLALDLRLGHRAVSLDLSAREVELDGGSRLAFDGLVIATGASARALPDTPPLEGIHTLRSLDDSLAIRSAFERSPRVLIVGAGFIGAEVAASARQRGLDVTMVEALEAPLVRAVGGPIGEVCAAVHRDQGVDLRCGVGVEKFEGTGRVERALLSDGSAVDADLVVVGIGVRPEIGWLASSGLAIDDGVVCDAACATAVEGIVAAGDVCRWHNPLFDEFMRVEHWMNASEQGPAAAVRLLDGPGAEPFANVPFFWSDQFDRKIQAAGRPRPDDDVHVVDGSLAEREFVALYGRAGKLAGAVAFNRPRLLLRYRRRIAKGVSWEEALAES